MPWDTSTWKARHKLTCSHCIIISFITLIGSRAFVSLFLFCKLCFTKVENEINGKQNKELQSLIRFNNVWKFPFSKIQELHSCLLEFNARKLYWFQESQNFIQKFGCFAILHLFLRNRNIFLLKRCTFKKSPITLRAKLGFNFCLFSKAAKNSLAVHCVFRGRYFSSRDWPPKHNSYLSVKLALTLRNDMH